MNIILSVLIACVLLFTPSQAPTSQAPSQGLSDILSEQRAQAPSLVACEEDQPCWDPATMGNKLGSFEAGSAATLHVDAPRITTQPAPVAQPTAAPVAPTQPTAAPVAPTAAPIAADLLPEPVICTELQLGQAWAGVGLYCLNQTVPAAPICEEDEPCWDCNTMGNLICGPVGMDSPSEDSSVAPAIRKGVIESYKNS